MEDKKTLGKSIAWNTAGSVYYAFCQWLMTVIILYMARDYTPVGILGLSMTITNSFSSIASFGMRSFQVSDIKRVYSDENYIMSRRITCFAAYIGCIVYAFAIGSNTEELACILLYMIIRVVDSTEDVYQGVLQVNWRFDIIGISYILRGTLQIIAFVAVFMLTGKLYLAFLLMAALDAAVLLFFDKVKTKKIANLGHIGFDKSILKLLASCLKLVIYNFMAASLATVVRVSIRKLCGVDELGIYSTVSAPTIIIQLTASVIYSPFLPDISKCFFSGDRKRFLGYIKKILAIIAVSFIVINVAAYFLGEWALGFLYNKDIAANSDMLLPLVWCTFFAACVWFFAGMLIAIRRSNQLLIGVVSAFALNYIINKPLIKIYGPNGGSYSQVISEVALMIFYIIIAVFDAVKYCKTIPEGSKIE